MEIKKSPKADLEGKKQIFVEIGLIVALLLTIGMFYLNQSEVKFEDISASTAVTEQQVVEITRPEEPPKPEMAKVAAPVMSDIISVVDNSVTLNDNLDMFSQDVNEFTMIDIAPIAETHEEVIEEDVVVFRSEKMPSFMGGDTAEFTKWVQANVKYPAVAEENNITGNVIIKFVIDKTGSMRDIQVLSSPDRSLSDEVMRVMKSAPKWAPGEQRGKPVSVFSTIRIIFTL